MLLFNRGIVMSIAPSAAGPSSPLEFVVETAERQFQEAGKVQNLSFWAFKIACRCSLPGWAPSRTPSMAPTVGGAAAPEPATAATSSSTVETYVTWHRYSDFEFLVESLREEMPGELIPPIPDKASEGTLDKFSDLVSAKERETAALNPLVASRVRRLNLFLSCISRMSACYESSHVKAFATMAEAAWILHKAETKKRREATKPAGVAGFFGGIMKKTKKDEEVFDGAHPICRIARMQTDLGITLGIAMRHLEDILRNTSQKMTDAHRLDEIYAVNSCKAAAYPLIFPGHHVSSKDHLNGTVKHVDDANYAYVDWGDGRGLDRLPSTMLQFPPTGIIDPSAVALHQTVTQIESYNAYLGRRKEARDLEKIIDLFWFWSEYAKSITVTMKQLVAVENDRFALASQTKPDPTREQRVSELGMKFTSESKRFENSFAFVFRPMQRRGLADLAFLAGEAAQFVMHDSDWSTRLMPAEAALPLSFTVPDDVLQMMEHLAGGAASAAGSNSVGGTAGAAASPPRHMDPDAVNNGPLAAGGVPRIPIPNSADYGSPAGFGSLSPRVVPHAANDSFNSVPPPPTDDA